MARRRNRPAAPASVGMPAALRDRLAALLVDELPLLEQALNGTAPVSIRANPAKPGAPSGEAVPWCSTGRYLLSRPVFTLDPLLHAGAYYVQEASSMLLEQALLAADLTDRPILAMDLCAAPGGKSTLLRSLLHPDSLLVANEVDRKRQHILQENLWKWGMPNVVVSGSTADALDQLPDTFDLIIVDAPCSGEGLFRKDAFARQQWSEGLVQQCATIQHDLVLYAWRALRPGGVLIYSTCTWETAENEERLAQLAALGALDLPIPAQPSWGTRPVAVDRLTGLRCYPHRVRGEGFFLAAMRKPGAWEARDLEETPSTAFPELRQWLLLPEHWELRKQGTQVHAVYRGWGRAVSLLDRHLHLLAPGRPVAEQRADQWRPHPALALDGALDREAFPQVELDRESALRFLRGEAVPATDASGWALATHAGLGLGWLKGAGTRWNNHWPTPWRIRMHAG